VDAASQTHLYVPQVAKAFAQQKGLDITDPKLYRAAGRTARLAALIDHDQLGVTHDLGRGLRPLTRFALTLWGRRPLHHWPLTGLRSQPVPAA